MVKKRRVAASSSSVGVKTSVVTFSTTSSSTVMSASIATTGTRSKRKSFMSVPTTTTVGPPALSPAVKKHGKARKKKAIRSFPAMKERLFEGEEDELQTLLVETETEFLNRTVRPDPHLPEEYLERVAVVEHEGVIYDAMLCRVCSFVLISNVVLIINRLCE